MKILKTLKHGMLVTMLLHAPLLWAQSNDGSAPAPSSSGSSQIRQTESQRRAVFFCNADQRDDELRHGFPTYTCDPFTGEKKPVPQTIIIQRDGNAQRVFPQQNQPSH